MAAANAAGQTGASVVRNVKGLTVKKYTKGNGDIVLPDVAGAWTDWPLAGAGDLVVTDAAANRWVEFSINALFNNGVAAPIDIGVYKGGVFQRRLQNKSTGITGWYMSAGAQWTLNGLISFQIAAGDVHTDGSVTYRLMHAAAGGTKTVYADAVFNTFSWQATGPFG